MKREIIPPSRNLLLVYRVIITLILVLFVVLIAGSLYALIRPSGSGPLFRIGGSIGPGGPVNGGNRGASNSSYAVNVFSDIGTLRIPVAPPAAATVILSISFPYPPGDSPFTEELTSHTGEFRSIATGYFTSLPAEEIARLDEEAAKTEILKRYNALLRLGKIETLYFNDLMVIE